MKKSATAAFAGFVILGSIMAVGGARAYEYPLQFTPNAGARGLVVAGYQFVGKTVIGNCSYYTQHSGSGRGGGYKIYTTHYDQTCTWDLYGNLLSVKTGAPVVPAPLSSSGTQTIYAKRVGGYTGADSALPLGGFVFTKGPHYSWTTSNAYQVLAQQTPYTFTATMESDGEAALNVKKVEASALASTVTVNSTSCAGKIKPHYTCDVTVTLDPSRLSSPTGLAYDTLTIALTTNSRQVQNFVQSYTISVRVPVDGPEN
ncbi:MAG TPA: hypothetical protein VG798_06970 [Rhizomicrobium sp.]|nr:hypothetical protein [Rhizomicrobium sp.]